MSEILKVAMPKGRIYKKASELFRAAGIAIPADIDESRKLVIPLPEAGSNSSWPSRWMFPLM